MPKTLPRLLHSLRRLAAPGGDDTDAALLSRFCRDRDEASFTALMARHGLMVHGVCRRVLGDAHLADDAFQATFLVLARKAGSIGRPESLAGWLYGVAYRVALKARGARRPAAEAPEPIDPRPDPLAEVSARDLLAAFEQELQRLPETFRLPVALCCLEGLSQEEAARRLGWSAGSVKGRLERGRERLRSRLIRRGWTLPAALAAVEASRGTVSAGLIGPTARAAVEVAAGVWPVGEVTQRVITLAQGGALAMSNRRFAMVALMVLGLVGSGVGWLAVGVGGEQPAGAVPAKPGGVGGPRKSGQPAQLEQLEVWKKRLAEATAYAERLDADLTERLVESRQSLAELEDRLREAEGDLRVARQVSEDESELRAERRKWMKHLRERNEFDEPKRGDEDHRKAVANLTKWINKYDRLIADEEDQRRRRATAALDRVNDLRRQVIRRSESVRTMEHKRDVARRKAESEQEVLGVLIRQLEGLPEPSGADRSTRALERRLDTLQSTLDGLLQEVKRLPIGQKE
ncbi:MAG: sigma-70 family RNA polymerase sigma factor [Gemmataceae bacterium]